MADISSLVLKVDSSGVSKASEDLDGFSKSAESSASAATEFADSTISINDGALKAAAGTAALTAAAMKLVSSLGEAGMSALKMYSHFEQMENGLSTVFQSAEKGKAVFEDLRAFSFKTTFGVDELADAATQLYNVGMAEDDVKGKLAMLGDLAGGQKQKFAELVSIYGKIVSTGQAGSMQMQQLALRGIPIKQVLQDMGVVGTASAEQITAAFEKMTGEGGRFHDAMNSIIDTIEGKEGFLSDTLKEMGVNFAEASGLAGAYKDALDVLYGGVQALTDKLADIGDDPFSKALFQGTLAAIIGGVGVALTTALVPALGAVAAKMGIIATLTAVANPAALIGGAVAGVGVLALSKAVEHSKELNKEHDELVEKRNELQKLQDNGTATFEEQIELQRTQIALLEEARDKEAEGIALYGGDDEYYRETIEALDVEKQKLAAMLEQKATMEKWAKIYKVVEANAQRVKNLESERAKIIKDHIEKTNDWYEKTDEGQLEKIKENLKTAIALRSSGGYKDENATPFYNPGTHMYETGTTWLSEEQKKKNQEYIKELENEMKTLNQKIAMGPDLYSAHLKQLEAKAAFVKENFLFDTGVSDKSTRYASELEHISAKIKENMEWLIKQPNNASLVATIKKQRAEYERLNAVLETRKELESAVANTSAVESDVKMGLASRSDGYNALVDEYKARIMNAAAEKAVAAAEGNADLVSSLDREIARNQENLDLINRQADAYGYMADKLQTVFEKTGLSAEASQMLAQGITNIVSTQIPNTLVSGFESIGEALGTGASAGDAMKDVFLNFTKTLLSQMSATCIQAGIMLIAQSGWAGVPAALALFALGGVSGIGAGVLGSSSSAGSDYEQKEKEQLELLKALNDQYKSLYSAMKEQEEYYLQKRRQITSTGINEGAGLTQVNDMILTPQGNFSTSPKDYLIATKEPGSLFNGGGETKISVVINNSMGDSANVTAHSSVGPEGQQELVVAISKKIAQDYATGMNGWDYAIDANSSRRRGRSLA